MVSSVASSEWQGARPLALNDRELAQGLGQLQRERGHLWLEANDAESHRVHGLFQYPAMMVPLMQRDILQMLRDDFDAPRVWDPFVGSGTTLAEAMGVGLDFTGRDINPLAILICRVKAGPYHVAAFESSAERVLNAAAAEKGRSIEVVFPNRDKWFRLDAAIALSRLRRAIRAETNAPCRRFHWLALAETVRLCSNSRVSTVKLHVRSQEERNMRKIDVYGTYQGVVRRNLDRLSEQCEALREAGHLRAGHYTGDIRLELGDIRGAKVRADEPLCQIGLTSPPYGDNTSTVPYGQQAYLPLHWIDLRDIHADAGEEVLSSTYALDSMSLGGSKRLAPDTVEILSTASASLAETFKRLHDLPADRTNRVAAFFRDLDNALTPILDLMDDDGVMAWTVGNRNVGGEAVPLDAALVELLHPHDVALVGRLEREIPRGRKRMPKKNGHADTIGSETVLVFRK